MNLTKSDREAFVRAVMDDVPMVDYDEQVWELLSAAAIELMLEPENTRSLENHAVWKEVEKLGEQADAQEKGREAMQRRLTATIGACRTLKQAQRMLPEFEKYLPKERGVTGTTNLPVANLVADLTALGWPK